MIWVSSVTQTLFLVFVTALIALSIGLITAVSAWWSNKTWAYYIPLMILGVPPWLLTYFISDYGYLNPWLGASISLGVCTSVYPHSLISASLANRAHKSWEMMIVVNGSNFRSLVMAVWPSIRHSILPSLAIIGAEVIADFGVSNFYGLNTVTMLTYNIWSSTWNLINIWQGIFVLVVLSFVISRLNVINVSSLQRDNTSESKTLWGIVAILPTVGLLTFGIYKSLEWTYLGGTFLSDDFVNELGNTIYLISIVVGMCLLVSGVYLAGITRSLLERSGLALYTLPGAVIGAVSIYILGPYITMFLLLSFAITLRYYGLMINTIASADKGNQKYIETVDIYVAKKIDRIKIKSKLIMPSIILGICLIVLDTLRELPISMILQPMNFQTVAMRMSYIARNEAIPSLGPHSLVLMGLGMLLSFVIIRILHDTDKKFKL